MATGLKVLLTMALLGAPMIGLAESLPDPTRPAIDLEGGGGGTVEGAKPAEQPTRGLQSIIISPLLHAAVINGQTVRVGESFGGEKLIEVRENSVVFQGSRGQRVMKLFPKVDIKNNKTGRSDNDSSPEDAVPGEGRLPEKAVGGVK